MLNRRVSSAALRSHEAMREALVPPSSTYQMRMPRSSALARYSLEFPLIPRSGFGFGYSCTAYTPLLALYRPTPSCGSCAASRQHRAEGGRDRHPGNRSTHISTILYDKYYKSMDGPCALLDAAQVLSGPLRCHRFAARLESHTCDTLHPLSTVAAAGYNRRRWCLHQSFPIEATFTVRRGSGSRCESGT